MTDQLIEFLAKRYRSTAQVCEEMGMPEGRALFVLCALVQENRVQRLQHGAWTLSRAERQRRERKRRYEYDKSRQAVTKQPNATQDPSPFPPPWWSTPDVGLWGV